MDLTATAVGARPNDAGLLVVRLDQFHGPLDLLLHLVRKQDIDVFDIPIAKITAQFLTACERIERSELENAGEFLEMAAMLVRIKAQVLLPRREDDEEPDPRAELVRRLLQYEQIREISNRLSVAEAERARRFGKGYVVPRPRPVPSEVPLETTWDEVMAAAMAVSAPQPRDSRYPLSLGRVAMEDKITLILDSLREVAKVEFSRLLEGLQGLEARVHGVMTFLAGLELSRRRVLSLRQVEHFGPLWLFRRDEVQDAEAAAGHEGEVGVEQAAADVEASP